MFFRRMRKTRTRLILAFLSYLLFESQTFNPNTYELFCVSHSLNTNGNEIVTLKRSPSRYNPNVPPCILVSDSAIDNPSPLPSVLLEISPRINRSVSSFAEIFNGCSEIFFRLNTADPAITWRSAYTLVSGIAYFAVLL